MAVTNKEINLGQLDQELGGKGLIADFNDDKKKLILPSENSDVTETQLEAAIAAHVAQSTEPTIEHKLASVGVTITDLKTALGL
jgi:hypothetical protein